MARTAESIPGGSPGPIAAAPDARPGSPAAGATRVAAPVPVWDRETRRTLALRLSVALLVVGGVAALLTLVVPDLLRGLPAMNGSARGTALALLVAGFPALTALLVVEQAERDVDRTLEIIEPGVHARPYEGTGSARVTRDRFSAPIGLLWVGTLGYIVYNAVMFLLGTPFNVLFPLYAAMLTLSLGALVTLLTTVDVAGLAARLRLDDGLRGYAGFVGAVVALNLLAWSTGLVPGLLDPTAPAFLDGTGLTTSPVYVQDLAVWLPLGALGAWWAWRRRPWGVVVVGGFLALWVLEGISVALDQWLGSRADAASPAVSSSVVAPFLVLAAVQGFVLWRLLRREKTPAAGNDRA